MPVDPFGGFTQSLQMAIPLVLRTKALQQEEQQFQAIMGQKKMQLAQENAQEQQRIALQQLKEGIESQEKLYDSGQKAGDPAVINFAANNLDRLYHVGGIPTRMPRNQDGTALVLPRPEDKLSLDNLTAQALRNNDTQLLQRITALKQASATKVSSTNNFDLSGKGLTKLVEKQAESLEKERPEAEGAVSGLQNLREAKSLIDKGIITGTGADYVVSVGNFLSSRLGIKFNDDPIANTQTYAATMGKEVGRIIKQFGSGTGLSDADREYAEKIAAGKITLTEKALRKLIDINERVYKAQISQYNKKAESVMKKPGSDQLLYDMRIEVPKEEPKQNMKQEDAPPVPNAKKAPDGNWYVEVSPGKFAKVEQ